MKSSLKRQLVILFLFFASSVNCSENSFQQFQDNSDDELFFAAKEYMNNNEWTKAIDKFSDMTPDYLAADEVRIVLAKAYAGRCGLDFLGLIESLGAVGAGTLFATLMASMPNSEPANIADCISAQGVMQQIGATAAARKSDQNLVMAYIMFAKIGAILNYYATDVNNNLQAGFNACTNGAPTGGISEDAPDRHLQHVGSGLIIALNSLGAAGSSIGGDELSIIDALCSNPAIEGQPVDFCNIIDETLYDADQIKGIRTFIKEDNAIGLGADCDGDVTVCNCP